MPGPVHPGIDICCASVAVASVAGGIAALTGGCADHDWLGGTPSLSVGLAAWTATDAGEVGKVRTTGVDVAEGTGATGATGAETVASTGVDVADGTGATGAETVGCDSVVRTAWVMGGVRDRLRDDGSARLDGP